MCYEAAMQEEKRSEGTVWKLFPSQENRLNSRQNKASSQTTSSLLEQKKPGQQFVKEAGRSLELQLCVEASNSPEWPLGAPCAQGKPASTLHFPASPAIPKSSRVPVISQMHLLCYTHEVSCLF